MLAALEDCASAQAWLAALEKITLSRAKKKHDNYSALSVWCARPA